MNNNILKYLAAGALVMTFSACENLEDKLSEPKVYFENAKSVIEVFSDDPVSFDLTTRLTTFNEKDVDIVYSIADESAIEDYNTKHGTTMGALEGAVVSSMTTKIKAGGIYSDVVKINIEDPSDLQEGKSYLFPIRIESSSISTIKGSDLIYFIVKKPVKITDVGHFKTARYGESKSYLTVPLTDSHEFEALTYEALINVSNFGNNNTIMGCEGVMILRIGDMPNVPANKVQVAGNVDFFGPELEANTWYHIALVCDGPNGKATIYLNGEKFSEAGLAKMPKKLFTATEGFSIGLVPNFMWGERPFNGLMSEVRLWNVARTANQIRENMMSVDPDSKGLLCYYKLNQFPVVDATPNHLDPKTGSYVYERHLDPPLMKVN